MPAKKKVAAKKVAKSSKKPREKKEEQKFSVELTKPQLSFLRDLFGLSTPVRVGEDIVEGNVCQLLAEATERLELEEALWETLAKSCVDADIVVGEAAPGYGLSAYDVPTMHVYEMDESE
jgi:hypothetical protein